MKENVQLDNDEFLKVLSLLQMYHGIFYKLWLIGKPEFTDKIPTAAIGFDSEGQAVQFIMNKTFWDGLTDTQKCFIICHEMKHVLLSHGKRIPRDNQALGNIAADLAINHSLIDAFSFRRQEIDPEGKYCWVDTVFKDSTNIKTNETLEYYYNLLVSEQDNVSSVGQQLVDEHTFSDKVVEELDEFIKEFVETLPESEIDEFNKLAGTASGNQVVTIKKEKVKKKRKWETVIKKWSKRFLTENQENEQWARVNRRVELLNFDMFIPSEMESHEENFEKSRINVWFFQDTSGSCAGFAKRFFSAARSLPPERFDIKMHCFDTRVFETTLESGKLYGFGGTSFTCIENYIQKQMGKTGCRYPDAIFVITDGYGNYVHPEKPKKWHWFLSTNYTRCIPPTCKVYQLKDYE